MVTLPHSFVPTKYPGYFWNVDTQTLFTLKLGVLRELKYYGPNQWNNYVEGYRISHKGVRRTLCLDYLRKLKPAAAVFPVEYIIRMDGKTDKGIAFHNMPTGTVVKININC